MRVTWYTAMSMDGRIAGAGDDMAFLETVDGEAHVLLIERAGTPNTGSAGGDRTVEPVPLDRAR